MTQSRETDIDLADEIGRYIRARIDYPTSQTGARETGRFVVTINGRDYVVAVTARDNHGGTS